MKSKGRTPEDDGRNRMANTLRDLEELGTNLRRHQARSKALVEQLKRAYAAREKAEQELAARQNRRSP